MGRVLHFQREVITSEGVEIVCLYLEVKHRKLRNDFFWYIKKLDRYVFSGARVSEERRMLMVFVFVGCLFVGLFVCVLWFVVCKVGVCVHLRFVTRTCPCTKLHLVAWDEYLGSEGKHPRFCQ